jgi:hypothetical protein
MQNETQLADAAETLANSLKMWCTSLERYVELLRKEVTKCEAEPTLEWCECGELSSACGGGAAWAWRHNRLKIKE